MKYRYRSDEEMKDSGVEWIGKIPKDWEVKKLKRISNIITGNTPSKNNEDNYKNGYMQWIKPDNIMENFTITDSKEKLSGEGVKQARIIPKNSAIVCCIGTVGKLGINTEECATNQQINSVIFNNKKIFNKFGIYSLIASRQEHEKNSNKVVVSILNKSQQGNIEIALSNYEKQEKIAKFLDEKTSYFNNIISKKEKLIEKLEEAKKSLISEVVTGKVKVVKNGDDFEIVKREDSEMKDSGVEWIGKIPKDFNVSKIKYICEMNKNTLSENTNDEYEIKYIDIGSVNSNGEITEIQLLKFKDAPSRARRILSDKDIIISTVRTYLKAITSIKTKEKNIICSTGFVVLTPKENINYKYLSYFVRENTFVNEIVSRSKGVSYPAITSSEIGNLEIIVPDKEEQDLISEYVSIRIEKIDNIIKKIKKQIAKLKEAKRALISEAVTGKIEILD